jgi:ABC-2 type transport system ATP-binding protein
MTAIDTTGLTKRYGDVTAVDGVDLTVESGEVFGFLGPNGAGKSTTINALLGFIEPTAGTVDVLGQRVSDDAVDVRARMGVLPDELSLYENLSGRHHVRSAVETKGADDDPDELIERVGLDPADARRDAGEYSKGMTQRLALAIALVGDPDLLVLDEPSTGLDPNGIKRLRRIVREEAERGATVFFSSHILDQVEAVCDRVGILNGGELVAVDAVADLRDRLDVGVVVEATVDPVPDSAVVEAVDGVSSVSITDDTVRATCTRADAKLQVLDELRAVTTVRNFETETPSLESLFDEYTQRAEASQERTRDSAAVAAGGVGR